MLYIRISDQCCLLWAHGQELVIAELQLVYFSNSSPDTGHNNAGPRPGFLFSAEIGRYHWLSRANTRKSNIYDNQDNHRVETDWADSWLVTFIIQMIFCKIILKILFTMEFMVYEQHWAKLSNERGPKMIYSNPSMSNFSRKKIVKIYFYFLNCNHRYFPAEQ